MDEVYRVQKKWRWQANIRMVSPYHDYPKYIRALKDSVVKHIKTLDWKPDIILASFHGLPRAYFEKGDPYHCFCQKTGRLLKEALKKSEDQFKVTFQSRFGPKAWLTPYTDETVSALASDGVKKMLVITPGFAADCVETLEEIGIGIKEQFLQEGGTHFSVVPCLNNNDAHIHMMTSLIEDEIWR